MYICVCNAITERQVRACVAAGATTLGDLQFELGVASCCGCCAQTAQEYLPGGARAGQPAVLVDHRIRMVDASHSHPANGFTSMAAAA